MMMQVPWPGKQTATSSTPYVTIEEFITNDIQTCQGSSAVTKQPLFRPPLFVERKMHNFVLVKITEQDRTKCSIIQKIWNQQLPCGQLCSQQSQVHRVFKSTCKKVLERMKALPITPCLSFEPTHRIGGVSLQLSIAVLQPAVQPALFSACKSKKAASHSRFDSR